MYNAGTDPQLKDAAVLLSEVVLPELDRRFDKFVEPVTAEIEDRTGIQRRAVERHRDAKTANLREQQDLTDPGRNWQSLREINAEPGSLFL